MSADANIAADNVPVLTINHEATIDLDSSNAFEGPEKLLEVWFAASPAAIPESARDAETGKLGLKRVSNETWTHMLDLVNCKVLSVVESEEVDAYLLSESSMFVFAHKVILKTCGTTTLLLGLQAMLQAAAGAGFAGNDALAVAHKESCFAETCKFKSEAGPYRVFYSRKNFLFPDRQIGPHRSWNDEVGLLDKTFKKGAAYLVGKMNGDHWYLWIMGPSGAESAQATTEHIQMGVENNDDETLEVLMTDLDEANAKQFYLAGAVASAEKKFLAENNKAVLSASIGSVAADAVFDDAGSSKGTATPDTLPEELTTEGHALGTLVSEGCGLSSVYDTERYPDAVVDAYMFNPCGFSANGVIPAPVSAVEGEPKKAQTHYFTVHVTPEPICSYASFETNVPAKQTGRETKEVIEHVVGIFKPGRFSVTLFEARAAAANVDDVSAASAAIKKTMDCVKGYRCTDRIVLGFEGYDLVFRYYEADDWVEKENAVKIGERN